MTPAEMHAEEMAKLAEIDSHLHDILNLLRELVHPK